MTKRHHTIFYLVFLLVLARTAPAASAQGYTVDIKPVRGLMPTADQVRSPIDSIDPVSGKMHTSIPLASLPRGRAGSGFDVALQYDSHIYDINPVTRQYTINIYSEPETRTALVLDGSLSTGGWTYNYLNFRLDLETLPYDQYSCPVGTDLRIFRLRVGLPDGSQHILQLTGGGDSFSSNEYYGGHEDGYFGIAPNGLGRLVTNPATSNPDNYQCYQGWTRYGRLTYYTTDGSYLKLEIDADGSDWTNKTWYLYFPDGRIAEGRGHQIDKIRDANGNAIIFENITSNYTLASTKIYHEEDGPNSDRDVIITYNTQSTSTAKTDTISGPGPNGRITWTVNWQLMAIGSNGRLYVSSDGESLNPGALNDFLGANLWVVKDVQLPMEPAAASPSVQNSYAFGYSGDAECGFGEIKSIRTPSNSTYTYSYALEQSSNCLTYLASAENIANFNSVTQRQVTGPGIQTLTTQYQNDHYSNYTKTEVIAPDLGKTTYWFDRWTTNLVYRIDEPNGSVRKRLWAKNKSYDILESSNNDPNNPYIQKETVTVPNGSGTPTKTMVTDYAVDKNGNTLQQTEYDWVDYAGEYNGSTGIENGSTVKRITINTYYVSAPAASDTTTNDWREYWYPHPTSWVPEVPRRLNAVHRVDVGVPGAISSSTAFVYDDPYKAGNLTATYRWNNFSDLSTSPPGLGSFDELNSQVLTRHYDSYGNVTQIDAPEVPTRITYDSAGHFPTQVEYAYTDSAHRTSAYFWYPDGSLHTQTDVDNSLVKTFTYDDLGRPLTGIDSASGTNIRKTQTIYDDANRKVTTKRDLSSLNDGSLQTATTADELGRVILMQASEGTALAGDTDGIKVTTIYSTFTNGTSPGGNRVVSSTPYRTTSDATLEWSCTQSDPLGRVTDVGMFTGSSAPTDCTSSSARTGLTTTAYDSDQVTVTDPASRVRREIRDGLGRLTTVVEDPNGLNYSTAYAYDPLDRLTQVSQGSQTRTFHYSSLGLLKDAANPESGTIGYTYTDSGDLLTRTDARGFSTTYGYDGLHRVVTKEYAGDSGVTPNVTYAYYGAGSAAGSVGQLQSVTSLAAFIWNSYDALGRVENNSQRANGNESGFHYTYRLNDGLASMQYPSGKIVNYAVDSAGRTNKVSTSSKTYADLTASSSPFTADGRIAQMKLGNDLWETRLLQTPGTPTKLQLGTSAGSYDKLELEFGFSGTTNNGNLASQVIRQPGHTPWTQSYSYDGVNRLLAASETSGFSRTYGYDQYGNRWISASSGITAADSHEPTAGSLFNTANNRLANQDYDAAGNQTSYDPRTLTYDAENRMIRATSPINGNEYFLYDGDGRRVRKAWTPYGGSLQVTTYVYGLNGQVAAEYTNQAASATGTSWMFADLLGSVRAVTGEKPQSGAAPMTECYDYLPFGRILSSSDNGRNTGCYPPNPDFALSSVESPKFTSKVRDVETGLDFFGARYFSAGQGRFISPDAAGPDPRNPQTLNKYRYALNNPLRYVDPNGFYEKDVHQELTTLLALAAGYGIQRATAIGAATQWVDDDPKTNPTAIRNLLNTQMRADYHFTSEERRSVMWNSFEHNPSIRALGEYMHAFEDSYAHEGYTAERGHASDLTAPDKTYNNPVKADKMAEAAFGKLVAARGALKGDQQPIEFNDIRELVSKFNRAKEKEKPKVLDDIRLKILKEREDHKD